MYAFKERERENRFENEQKKEPPLNNLLNKETNIFQGSRRIINGEEKEQNYIHEINGWFIELINKRESFTSARPPPRNRGCSISTVPEFH